MLKKDDFVVGMDVINDLKNSLLIVMERGIGKKSPLAQFPKQKRGGMGVLACRVTDKTGKVITARIIQPDYDSLILTSIKGQVVKLPIGDVPLLARATQGVILMRFSHPQDLVAASTCLIKEK